MTLRSLSLLALLLCTLSAAARAVEVRNVRLWGSPDGTRVVLELSGNAQHSLSVLHNPERAVLEVGGAKLAKGAHAPGGSGAVRHVRLSQGKGEVRLVMDLSRPSQAKSFVSRPNKRYGYRLVVDLNQTAVASGTNLEPERPIRVAHQ